MLTYTTSLIIAAVCVIVGAGLGTLIALAISNRGNESKNTPAAARGPYDPVVTLMRDKKDSSLLIEVDGRVFASPEPLGEGQHEALRETAREWVAWLRLPSESEEGESQAAPAGRAASNQSKTTPLAESARPGRETRAPLPRAGASAPPLVAAAVASNVERSGPAAAAGSIVEQINDILQDMVAGTPLAEKSIRLVEEPDSDVIVWIGLEHFEGINNVPDIEARTIIQAAVREWEKKSESNPNNRPY